MSTGNLTPSERRRLDHEEVVCLEARRNKRFDEECNRSSSEDKENDIEDEEGNCIEDDKVDIMNGLGITSKELAENYSDSDFQEYEFREDQQQIKVAQKEENLTINKWKSLIKFESTRNGLEWLAKHSF